AFGGGDMRASRHPIRILAIGATIVLACRDDDIVHPSFSVASSPIQSVEVTDAKLAIEKLELIGATEDIPPFKFFKSFAVNVDLGGVITRLQSFSVPAGSYAMAKVKVGKLDGDPMLGRSILVRGNVTQNGVASPFVFTSTL